MDSSESIGEESMDEVEVEVYGAFPLDMYWDWKKAFVCGLQNKLVL